jgi:hypothetical protein
MKNRQQNVQKFERIKEEIRSRKSKDRQRNGHHFEDTKREIQIRKSPKDRKCNGQTFKDTILVSSNIWSLHLCVRRFTDSDYSYGIFKCVAIALSVL